MSVENEEPAEVSTNLFNACSYLLKTAGSESLNFGRGLLELLKHHSLFDSDTFDSLLSVLIHEKFWEHPILGLGLLGCGLVCLVPVAFFITFLLASLIFTLFSFVFIEGLILAGACLLMIPCIFAVIFAMSLVAVLLSFSYFFVLTAKDLAINAFTAQETGLHS